MQQKHLHKERLYAYKALTDWSFHRKETMVWNMNWNFA
jgi:hypothetical protein